MLMLLFSISDDLYACAIKHVLEIVPRVKVKQLPHSSDFVMGLMNFEGLPIPVVDLCQLIHGRPCRACLHSRIILLKRRHPSGNEQFLGIVAEKVTETLRMDEKAFVDSGVSMHDLPFLRGVYSSENSTVQLLSIDHLFQSMEGKVFRPSGEMLVGGEMTTLSKGGGQ